MTQLVQLQGIKEKLEEAGYSVFAISNDPVEILADFASKHDITFSLLSDGDSAVIRAFGIMNQLIRPDEGQSMRWHGIPYPGTYYVDPNMIVTDKDFHQHHARRASGSSVLARALGQEMEVHSEAESVDVSDQINVSIGLSEPALQLEVISQLLIDIEIPEGTHAYASGAPNRFTCLSLDVDGDGIRIGDVSWPASEPMNTLGMDEEVPVYKGRIRASLPITVTSDVIRLGHEIPDALQVSVAVSFQLCDEYECFLPERIETTLTCALNRLVEPEGLSIYAERVEVIEAETGKPVR
ncbi:MAG: redoxin domain-containing protein [Acidimicrobiales bacterium]|nr:redoxin domain-containing protein [Acidimicrobiales bacterium]